MPAGFAVFVDESGDEGFKFAKGSKDWFALSAVVTRVSREPELMKMVADIRALLKKPVNFALHFKDLKHEQRIPYVEAIARQRLRTITVLILSSPHS